MKKKCNSQSAFALIKFFTHKEHYLSFLAGTSLFRTPHYYRTCEDIGRGDRNESCVLFWEQGLSGIKPKFFNPDGTENINKAFKSLLVYPIHEQHDAWMQSWSIIGPNNDFDGSLEKMQQEFGSFFVILPAKRIEDYAHLVEKSSGLKVRFGSVQYSEDPTKRSLTVKDSKYSYQKEFRFFAGECSKGMLEDKFFKLPKLGKLLLDVQSLELTSPNGVITYCSVGYKGIVTVKP
ncbi:MULTISPECIES: hypothetical protein [unclassified Pseudoalteromonas]|uniref:hypothetical protein n=1 Tax=unclassified Pseudoalteromonas TaxID=194690 RepID=UPI001EF0688C|nr:hypothetical protein [Pseudoalteromonas sp. L21]MCF7519107.1 hypothetical protein [Pseudoalteromonas sp. L21]UJX24069.1 hypothetical protein L3Q70_08415 [Pseudoalteromonas sp. CF6-2]